MEADDNVEAVFLNHFHLHAPEQLAQHNALGGGVALTGRTHVTVGFLPVEPVGALLVAPEFRSRVKRWPVDQRFLEPAGGPIGRASRQVLRDVEAEEPFDWATRG